MKVFIILSIIFITIFSISCNSREKDIVKLMLQVLPHKLIADKLNVSISTVSKHVYQIYKKCKVHTNMELLKLFLE